MSNTIGKCFKISIFGESHSAGIGVVIDGIPAGMKIDFEQVAQAMARRAPNKSQASTKRKEADIPELLSGCVDGVATGTPLAAIIRNTDTRSQDYANLAKLMRPGHADYTGHIKYNAANDIRGGGHFSGRLTAPLVLAGSIATQYLASKGIAIGAHIKRIANILDADFGNYSADCFRKIEQKSFFVNDDEAGNAMQEEIARIAATGDSIGGEICCAIAGVPVGLGEPFFDSVESELAHMLFAIPAIKGVEFGAGFQMAKMRGSEANDCPFIEEGKVSFKTNHNGGINGGITNGLPVVFKVAVKPTPSISMVQQTVDIEKMEEAQLQVRGRHDACIVPRAVEVVKSAAALVFADMYMRNEKGQL